MIQQQTNQIGTPNGTLLTEPLMFREALSFPDEDKWKKAMEEELRAMQKNEVWILTKLPEGRKAVPNKWVYKYKTNPKGELERHRARLVCKGL